MRIQKEWRYIQKEDIEFTRKRDIYVVKTHTGSENTHKEWKNILSRDIYKKENIKLTRIRDIWRVEIHMGSGDIHRKWGYIQEVETYIKSRDIYEKWGHKWGMEINTELRYTWKGDIGLTVKKNTYEVGIYME